MSHIAAGEYDNEGRLVKLAVTFQACCICNHETKFDKLCPIMERALSGGGTPEWSGIGPTWRCEGFEKK